ncbi:YdcF family protein [Arthrobacter sp. NPDC090010]|uniref:YdcF family protein n=1 Tax=Arthrobacter sp. NPDC090010 TaxID=3363942 RepID=UPI003805E568
MKTVALRVAAAALTVLLLWLFVCVNLFCFPVQRATPARVDAVVVLGGSSSERLPAALELLRTLPGHPVLVLSTTDTPGNASVDSLCRDPESAGLDATLLCFHPAPLNTRGEAQAVRDLVAAQRWDSVAVLTSDYHLPRAGELMKQCVPVPVRMVASEPALDAWQWLRRFSIETGGLLDVTLNPECDRKDPTPEAVHGGDRIVPGSNPGGWT